MPRSKSVLRVVTHDERGTMGLAANLARLARAGDTLCLYGPLGSGKTTFVKGFALGAGFKGNVMSPTFAVARLYRGGDLNLHHLDLFRVSAPEVPNLGLEEYLDDPRGICLIEWPEAALRALPADRLDIRMGHRASGSRSVQVRATGPCSARYLRGEKS